MYRVYGREYSDGRRKVLKVLTIVLYGAHAHRIFVLRVIVLPAVIVHVISHYREHLHIVGWIIDAEIVYMRMVRCVQRTVRV